MISRIAIVIDGTSRTRGLPRFDTLTEDSAVSGRDLRGKAAKFLRGLFGGHVAGARSSSMPGAIIRRSYVLRVVGNECYGVKSLEKGKKGRNHK
jgi:hypothetical protein